MDLVGADAHTDGLTGRAGAGGMDEPLAALALHMHFKVHALEDDVVDHAHQLAFHRGDHLDILGAHHDLHALLPGKAAVHTGEVHAGEGHQEGKDEKGHLEHTLHLIGDLHDLHLQLMKLSVGEHYRQTYAKLEPELPRLRAVVGNPGMNDTELCFRALYAAMLYRIKGEGDKQAVTDTLEYISPVIANLADMYGKVERGEIDLFKTDTAK